MGPSILSDRVEIQCGYSGCIPKPINGSQTGAIIGSIVGVLLIVGLIAAYVLHVRSKLKKTMLVNRNI